VSAVADRPGQSWADLLHRLGDIPPERVRRLPAPGTATLDDLLKPENKRCELVDGTLVEKAVGEEESFLGLSLAVDLGMYLRANNLGYLTMADGTVRLPGGGPARAADVAFFRWDRQPDRRRPTDPIPTHAPDLAVEVLSRSNTVREMARKRAEYFAAGTALVWEFDPRDRSVRVYTAPDTYTELTAADTLTGDPVLPGFRLKLADLFAELDRHG
jgi:Uma2 family endonuclease